MVTLISKNSSLIQFPGGTSAGPVVLRKTLTIYIETGVAVFDLEGTNPHDWTRDTLTFPVGPTFAAGSSFVSGMALGNPASFWTPLKNVQSTPSSSESFSITDGNGNPNLISFEIPGSLIPPPIGYAVDSATVTANPGSSQAQITLALAVFGNNAAMQRCSYTAYIVTGEGGIVVDPPVVSKGA
ncbi:hypothetical protein P8935_05055 [Telmatobacter sp. DSM 110680]|uniref:Uncharacterized protein n=1 Tax=Telmatobacter sp. DSM 110680 TaxID=3036704 RepID=A0AAU7DNN9_9BACT